MPGIDLVALSIAVVELAKARLRLAGLGPSELAAETSLSEPLEVPADRLPTALAEVAHLLPRVAARLPWRSDCLVQALAARRWLSRMGYDSRLSLGTRRDAGGEFRAHAWLTWRGLVVTGGDVDGYARLTLADSKQSDHLKSG